MEKYILTETELRLLLQDQKCLEALQAYGVDNWDGYEEAINDEEYTVTDADFEDYNRIGSAESKDVYNNYNWDNECRNG